MKNKIPFYFIDEVIVRSPIYPVHNDISEEYINSLLKNDFFLEAVYIASPLLYEETVKLKNGLIKSEKDKTKIILSLHKYISRMHTRSTPFGLFSTTGVGKWDGSETTKTLSDESLKRHTRLDMHFLNKMISSITGISQIQEFIRYYPNNSIYPIGSELRYVEYFYKNGLRHYKLSAITSNQYISGVLHAAKKGITQKEIVEILSEKRIPESDARKFIEQLISSQLLNSEFEVALTSNEDFTLQIQHHLNTIYQRSGLEEIKSLSENFEKIVHLVSSLDLTNKNAVSEYKDVVEKLKAIEPGIDESKTFHIDAYRVGGELKINEKVKDELLDLFEYLNKINQGRFDVNGKIEAFKRKFMERYETQSVLLAEVLDSDFGIGYPVDKNIGTGSLVNDIPFNYEEQDTQLYLNATEKWLLAVLRDPKNKNASSIALDEQFQPKAKEEDNWNNLPSSMAVMFRILNDDKETVLFEYFFGPSAASVLGRFAHGNLDIRSLVETIVSGERDVLENCLLAEIVHMPDNRITNVIMHPFFREYEIPYLANASVAEDKAITLEDLFIKVENNEIILFSKRLNKRIIPCKTHVHNHFTNTLPLYHFLGDLQNEGFNKTISFTWGNLSQLLTFLPRLTYKHMIVSPTMWSIHVGGLKQKEEESADLAGEIKKMKEYYSLPDKVLFSEGDNDLLIDFNNTYSVQTFINLAKNRNNVLLKEFLWFETSNSNQYLHQYIAPLINSNKRYFPNPVNEVAMSAFTEVNPQRTFAQGSEWLYLKIYCGSTSSDILLTKIIAPIVQEVTSNGLIKKWFFVKYVDPDFHIRLRFNLQDASHTGTVMSIINKHIDAAKDKSLIYKIVYDMYVREMERYGSNTIESCEFIFSIESSFALELLRIFYNDKKEIIKTLWGMKMVDDFLDSCQLTHQEKMEFADSSRKGFSYEFKTNKYTLDKINSKYSTYKNSIREIMSGESKSKDVYFLLQQKSEIMKPMLDEILQLKEQNALQVHYYSLLSSLIHMMLNRIITHKERVHEFIIYEFLTKYYTMLNHLKKADVLIK